MVIVERKLSHCLRERCGELARWNLVAEEHVADGVGCLRAAKPHLEYCRKILVLPVHHCGTTGEVEHHNGLAGLLQCLQQVELCIGQVEVAARAALTAELRRLAAGKHNHVGTLCHAQSLGTHCLGTARVAHLAAEHCGICLKSSVVAEVAAFGIEHFSLSGYGIFHALKERLVAVADGCHAPCARHISLGVGERTDKGDAALALKRKQVVLVLQQDECLGCNFACNGAVLG